MPQHEVGCLTEEPGETTVGNRPAVIAALRAALPAGIALAGGAIGKMSSSPFPVENSAIQHAVAKRRCEFVSGRHYARSAMSQLGMPAAAIATLPSRAPQWPAGLTGSISHAGNLCVAVVAMASSFIGIGIDLEVSHPLPSELYASVCRGDELSPGGTTQADFDAAKMLFVVKEAFFKLYHPLTGYFLDFLEVAVRLDMDQGTFDLHLLDGPPALMERRTFGGVCGHADAYCFAFVALERC